jgi:O-succinylbenzoic acid--CoA ligase
MRKKELNFSSIEQLYSNYPALIWSDGSLTYFEYFQKIDLLTQILINQGIKSGKRVAILSEIHYHFPIIFFALLKIGAVVFPINNRLPDTQIFEMIEKVDSDWLITIGKSLTAPVGVSTGVLRSGDLIVTRNNSFSRDIPQNLSLNQEATIIFTSGSQGKPKGVLHTIGNHYYSAMGSNVNIPLIPDDRWMITLPFYHVAGIAILFRTMLAGAAGVIPDPGKSFFNQIDYFKTTHLSLIPTQLQRMIKDKTGKDDCKNVKTILVGGGSCPASLIKQSIQTGLPLYSSYGSTEMASQITTTTADELVKNPKSSGKLLPYRELTIDTKGEILVKGETLFKRYATGYNDSIELIKDGWFRTGDKGYIDRNDSLIVTGRLDNMFISGGENIYPGEIERQLINLDIIRDVCVVDVPDEEYGAKPVAFVRIRGRKKIDEVFLKTYLENKISRFKIPSRFFQWPDNLDQLKPDRKELRNLALNYILSKK